MNLRTVKQLVGARQQRRRLRAAAEVFIKEFRGENTIHLDEQQRYDIERGTF